MGLILFIILAIAAFQIIQLLVYGGRVSKLNEELYSDLDTNKLSLNNYDSDILSLPYGIGRGDKIVKVLFSLYGRYRITGDVGMVKRKSKLDEQIEEYFKTVEDRTNKHIINNSRQYKKKEITSDEVLKDTFSPKDEEPVVPTTIRILLEEIRSGKTVHMDGREYKLVEHAPDSIENQLDNMLKDSMKEDESILKPFKED